MASTDSKKWFAKVRYYNGDIEDISVRKIKTQQGNHFSPKNYKDFNANVLYSVKTSMSDVEGKEQRYYAYIGKLAESVEKLNNNDKRISWPTWPSDVLDEPENSSQDEIQENAASSSIAAYRGKAALQKSKRRAATDEECQKFLQNYNIGKNSLNKISNFSDQITVFTGNATKECSQDKEKLSVDSSGSKTVSVLFEELTSLLNEIVQKMEEKIENRSTMIEKRVTDIIKQQLSQACENATSTMEGMLQKICSCGDKHEEKKINLGGDFYCTNAGLAAMEEATNDCDWAVALLVGVFGEDAKLMRMYPRKQGLKKFSLGFLMVAQNLYIHRLKHLNCEGNIDEMVKTLPAYLSDRALDLGGGRGIVSCGKRKNKFKNKNIFERTEKEAAGSVATSTFRNVSSTLKKPLKLKEKKLIELQDAVPVESDADDVPI